MIIQRLLVLAAHPDDAEFMAGGTIARLTEEGGACFVINLTHGGWDGPGGDAHRSDAVAVEEARNAAKVLGYETVCFNLPTMRLEYDDAIVCRILNHIKEFKPDALIIPWSRDPHRDHRITAELGLASSRKIPRVLFGEVNWYINDAMFSPNLFIDVSRQYTRKLEALHQYKSELTRQHVTWHEFIDSRTAYYGMASGCARAEGFKISKFRV